MISRRRFLSLLPVVLALPAGICRARSSGEAERPVPSGGGRPRPEETAAGEDPQASRREEGSRRSRPDGVSSASQRRAARKKRAKTQKD